MGKLQMKRKIVLSLIIVLVLISSVSFGAFAATKMKVIVNGKTSTVDPIVIKGVTYVPLRAAADMLGAKVNFDASTNTVRITGSGSETSSSPASKPKSYNVDVTVNSGPMILKISKVTLDPAYKQYSFESASHNALVFDVTVENTSTDKLTWYVDQTQLVLNTKEQIESGLMTEDRISSDFNGKVIKKGQIAYEVKNSTLEEVKNIRLLIKYVIDANFDTVAEDTETEITLE
jgi:hypothetical protein